MELNYNVDNLIQNYFITGHLSVSVEYMEHTKCPTIFCEKRFDLENFVFCLSTDEI